MTTNVRVTIEPQVVRAVDDVELLDLHRQGLLHSFERSATTDRIVGDKSPNRWKSADKDEEVIEAPAATTDPAANTNTNSEE